ncbi:MAG: cytochrome c [Saprospiraceae bacterium]
MKYYFVLITILFANYRTNQISNFHILDFGVFKLETPIDWFIIKEQGIDSYAGSLTNKRDTLSFNYGWYSSSVCDEDPHKYKLARDTVNGIIAYLILPITSGKGKIGMSIEKFRNNENKFIISGLSNCGMDTILHIFKSIRFEESDTTLNSILTLEKFNTTPSGSGWRIFKDNCAACHSKIQTIIGPPLKDINSKRTSDWIFYFLANRKALKSDTTVIRMNKARNNGCEEFPDLTRDKLQRILEYLNLF